MKKYKQTIKLEDGKNIILRQATTEDMDDIKHLYYVVYGGKYTLPEINDSDKMKWVINDPNYFWLLGEYKGEIVSSVIAIIDPKNRIGKTFAGIVHQEFRGNKLLRKKLEIINQVLIKELNSCDLIYAVVRTFAPVSLHEDLKEIGYVDLGIFPNVRKVQSYETHGLKAYYKEGILSKRKKSPRLMPAVNNIYEIIKDKLGLENATIDEGAINIPGKNNLTIDKLYIEKNKDIEWEYYKQRDAGNLLFAFYPFYYPELKLYTKNNESEVYIHFQEIDGHAFITGLRTGQDLILFLNLVCEYLESMDVKYLEIITPAYDSEMQKKLFAANFLPCAYFPALSLNEAGQREDYVVFCRNFVPLNFQGMHFFEGAKPYAMAFYKNYSEKLWKDLENA